MSEKNEGPKGDADSYIATDQVSQAMQPLTAEELLKMASANPARHCAEKSAIADYLLATIHGQAVDPEANSVAQAVQMDEGKSALFHELGLDPQNFPPLGLGVVRSVLSLLDDDDEETNES